MNGRPRCLYDDALIPQAKLERAAAVGAVARFCAKPYCATKGARRRRAYESAGWQGEALDAQLREAARATAKGKRRPVPTAPSIVVPSAIETFNVSATFARTVAPPDPPLEQTPAADAKPTPAASAAASAAAQTRAQLLAELDEMAGQG